MTISIKHIFFSLFVLQAVLLISCDKPEGPPPPPVPGDTAVHVTGLTIDPPVFVLLPTLTWQLSVNAIPANAGNKKVSWNSSDNLIATVDTNGLVTAIKVGSADITATSYDNNSVKAMARLTVLKNYDVYAVGEGYTSSWDNCAVYWKNGVKSGLPGGFTVGTNAFAIVLSGEDVYIAGDTENENHWDIPTYWKNGMPHIIGNTAVTHNSFTKAIAVDGNKVYLAGYGFYNSECPAYCHGRSRAFYWVDDAGTATQTPLYNDISSTVAGGIALKGNDVFVAGGQANDNFYRWSTVWKNNVSNVETLSATSGFYETNAIAWHGDDLFITGFGGCADFGCNATPVLIKNNINNVISLTDGTKDAQAYCMAFSGDVIYVGGYEKNEAGKYVAKYWKISGNTVSSRTLSDGVKSSLVNGIAVSGDDLFLIGSELSDAGERKAKCWRAYEGFSTPASLDLSDFYLPNGYYGYGICIR